MGKKRTTYALTIDEAKKRLKDRNIHVINGHIYSLYECGHIFDAVNDPQKTIYLSSNNSHNRVCPECDNKNSKLIVKYKKCGCGAEQLGYNVQQSECCTLCPPQRVEKYKKLNLTITTKRDSIYNEKFSDSTKWNCKFRYDCLTKYSKKHRAIPCKGCEKYAVWGF